MIIVSTRVYNNSPPGCTDLVDPGGEALYIRVEKKEIAQEFIIS
mgnify:CR=1 FL=1